MSGRRARCRWTFSVVGAGFDGPASGGDGTGPVAAMTGWRGEGRREATQMDQSVGGPVHAVYAEQAAA